jgi:hypothetical protein
MELYLRRGQRQPEPAAIEAYIRRRTGEFREALRGQSPALVVLPEDAIQFSLPASRSADAFARFGVENNGLMIEAYRDLAKEIDKFISKSPLGYTSRAQFVLEAVRTKLKK